MFFSKLQLTGLIVGVFASAFFSSANAFENQHFIGGGGLYGGASDTDAYSVFASYEYQMKDTIGFEIRPTYFSYEYEKGNQKEDGDGIGINVFANFYPVAGLLLGIGTGVSAADWKLVDTADGGKTLSDDSKVAIAGLAKIGYKFEVNNFFVTPMLEVAQYFATGEEVGALISVGVDLGYAF